MVQILYYRKTEPFWTITEIEKFWKVIESYLEELLKRQSLPAHGMDFMYLDPECIQDYKLCLKELHEGLWKGRYSETVANFRATKEFFEGGLQLVESTQSCRLGDVCDDELQALKKIFFEGPIFSNFTNAGKL